MLSRFQYRGWLKSATGLRSQSTFRFSREHMANEKHKGLRSALGLKIAKPAK
jgi:hypothetical protein